ncbi:36840_t:CDS:1, partial [Gigaspora margarita]
MEELPTQETEPKNKSLEQGLHRSIDTTHLSDKEQKAVLHLLCQEKDLFTRDMNDLGQTSAVIHEIDTRSAAPIKQLAYYAAPSMHEFIRKEIKKLKDK